MAVRALKAGAADFIEKPFNGQDMLDRIQTCLNDDHQLWHTQQTLNEAAAPLPDTHTPRSVT